MKQKLDTFMRFIRQVVHQFGANETSLSAAALAYTTLLSLVPFMAVLVTVFSMFPLFEDVSGQVQDFIFSNFVPTSGEVIQEYITGFVDKSRDLNATMSVLVFITSIMTMYTMEKALNRIWDTKPSGNMIKKVVMYWTVLTMGPLLVLGGLALTSFMFAYSGLVGIKIFLLKFLPVISSTIGFFLIYLVVPNRKVNWYSALIGALIAAILFEMAKRGFAWYVTTFPSMTKIYGALATIPIFIIWLFMSWVIVLLGATIAATLESSRWRGQVQAYSDQQQFLVIFDILHRLYRGSLVGQSVTQKALFNGLKNVPDDVIKKQLDWLWAKHVIQTNQDGEYILLRDLDNLSVAQLYTMGQFSLPSTTLTNFEFFAPFIHTVWSKIDADMQTSVKTLFTQLEKNNEN